MASFRYGWRLNLTAVCQPREQWEEFLAACMRKRSIQNTEAPQDQVRFLQELYCALPSFFNLQVVDFEQELRFGKRSHGSE